MTRGDFPARGNVPESRREGLCSRPAPPPRAQEGAAGPPSEGT